ncbi:hypothetical protein Celaphus_00018501, partial [Cervus elaphus hippelaphus]
ELTEELGELEASSDEEAMGDDMPDIPPETVTEEEYIDEHGHTVVKKVTRKIIRRFISSDGTEKEEITMQGTPQDSINIEEGDGYSKVIKRIVLKSDTEQSEALSYTGSHMKVYSPSLVENEVLKEDGSIIRRTTMSKARTQKRAVVKDQQGKRIYLEHLEDVPEALDQDDLQHDLQQLLRHFCKEDSKQEAQ